MIIDQNEFKSLLFNSGKNDVKFARIADGYTDGRPSLVFDGETTATIKRYPYLASYTPVSGERVLVISGVVIGKIM